MAAVCVMKDIKPDKVNDPDKPGQKILDYWGPSKKLLGDMSFLSMLKEYDKDNIPVSINFYTYFYWFLEKDWEVGIALYILSLHSRSRHKNNDIHTQ